MAWSAGVRRETVNQAARRLSRNLPTSSLRRLLSDDDVCAAESTCDEADPVSEAPRWKAFVRARRRHRAAENCRRRMKAVQPNND